MTIPKLGRLEKVSLRNVWKSESGDFTPWLAEAENLHLLGETIGLDLELENQEQEVGPFRADILCKNTLDNSWVLIENLIARTDHTHLGQILTYAAGLEAVTVVWVAERFTEEHRAALDWLNEITQDKFTFFGLEIEAWRIGDSAPAPKFNIVCKPNDWSREVKSSVTSGNLTERQSLQHQYWIAFQTYMADNSQVRCSKPAVQNWMTHSLGVSGAHLNSVASFWDSEKDASGTENRVDLYLDGPRAKAFFKLLLASGLSDILHEILNRNRR